jgi:hypothetical protein
VRFKPGGRYPFEDTSRKRAALRARQRREREALPLLSDLVAEEQPEEDDVMRERAQRWHQYEIKRRAHLAVKWREARARLRAYPQPVRGHLQAYWQRCGWPGDPVYLLSMLHMWDTGRLNLRVIGAEPWQPSGKSDAPQQTIAAPHPA